MSDASHLLALRGSLRSEDQSAALQACSGMTLKSPSEVKTYHDALLFVMAFPADAQIAARAEAEMLRLLSVVEKKQKNQTWQFALQGSGIMHTTLQCQFSAALTSWLLKRFPGKVLPADSAASPEDVAFFFQILLPPAEFQDVTQHDLHFWSRVKLLCGENKNASALQWVLQLTDRSSLPVLAKDGLYDSLKIFVQLNAGDHFSRSFLRLPAHLSAVNSAGNDGSQVELKPAERLVILDTMKASLCFYCRETDPVTYGDPDSVQCFVKSDGCVIALVGMEKERQLALESYIGFMVFKHGIPVAYGGGWLFGHRCKIGLNIYPPFRGAASAKIFRDVMDVYEEVFRVHRFLIKPYQFGKGNPDGIRSAAFWFYYKQGFRPENMELKKLATVEWGKIKADRKYRTSAEVLKKFTGSRMVRVMENDTLDETDPGELSSAITEMIRTKFSGDRSLALKTATAHLMTFLSGNGITSALTRNAAVQQWALLILALHPRTSIGKKMAADVIQLLNFKVAGLEARYQRQLQSCRSLF